jgi:hypothetical protein
MDGMFNDVEKMARVWTEMATKMMSTGMSLGPENAPPEVSKQMRGLMFQAMAQQAEQYMRSPQFVEMMKQSMDAAITVKKQLNDFLTQAHHAGQGVARQDVDAVLRSLHHLETRVLDNMEGICDRLDKITQRLEALEGGSNGEVSAERHRPEKKPKPTGANP